MKILAMTVLLSLITHGHVHRDQPGTNAEGWDEVYSHYETPSTERPRHYRYASRPTPSYRSSSRGVPTDSIGRFVD
jgi:hypothetical protein